MNITSIPPWNLIGLAVATGVGSAEEIYSTFIPRKNHKDLFNW